MCLAIPAQVVSLPRELPSFAKVEVGGVRRTINVGLIEDGGVAVGDWVLIHVGFALSKISETEAQDQLRMLTALGEATLAMDEISGYAFAADIQERPPW